MQKRRNFRSTFLRFLLSEFSVKFATAAITALCVIFLTGCIAVALPLGGSSREELSAKLPDQLSTTLPGQMNREEVRRKKGSSPVAESRYWRFDLFEENIISEIIPWVGFIIVPIGVFNETADYFRYTLVEYDENELIKSYVTDISDHIFPFSTQAGDLILQNRGRSAFGRVLASVARRDAYLQEVRSASTCTAVIGTSKPLRFNLDLGSPDGYLDDTDLAAASLAPGEHKLWLSEVYVAYGQPFPSLDFSCQAGEILYFEIKFESKYAKIKSHKTMPDSFVKRPLLLWKYGRWYTSPEPRK
jgi:hypothetical protein